jgi:hypothetical protein
MKMQLQWIPGLKPSVNWNSDDGEWLFHAYYDPVTLQPDKVFYRNPATRLFGYEHPQQFRLTKRSNPQIRQAVIAAIGDGSQLPRLKEEGEEREFQRKADRRREELSIFRTALAEGGAAVGRPEFARLAEELSDDQILELRQLR